MASVIENNGYRKFIVEFIDSEHGISSAKISWGNKFKTIHVAQMPSRADMNGEIIAQIGNAILGVLNK